MSQNTLSCIRIEKYISKEGKTLPYMIHIKKTIKYISEKQHRLLPVPQPP